MSEVTEQPIPRFLKLSQIIPGLIPVSKSTLLRWVRRGAFPSPIKLSTRLRVWLEADVLAWMRGTWVPSSGGRP